MPSKKKEFIVRKIIKSIKIDDDITLHTDEHFEKQNKRRRIPINRIKETFSKCDGKFPSRDYSNASVYWKQYDDVQTKIVIKDDKEPMIIITAYEKSNF